MIVFVTGTDTGVGKTVVASAILAAARARGIATRGIKPVESGCEQVGGTLVAADAQLLATAAGHEPDNLYRYELPLAPATAASEGAASEPDVDACAEHVHAADRETRGLVVVEGAGGLLVPLARGSIIADLAHQIGAPLVIVGRDGLGTINHTALTIESATRRGLRVTCFVFSATGEEAPARAHANAGSITEITGIPFGGLIPRIDPTESTQLETAGSRLLAQLFR